MHSANQNQPQLASDYSDTVVTLKNLKELYRIINGASFTVANDGGDTEESEELQSQLLRRKDLLVDLAIRTNCKDVYEISQKVDFLNLVHLDEVNESEYEDADNLTKSIWKDCQAFL